MKIMRRTHGIAVKMLFPVLILILPAVREISLGQAGEQAPKTATVVGWGYNGGLIVMKGEPNELPNWVHVRDLDDVISISAGGMHNLALRADGTVWTWGASLDLAGVTDAGTPLKVPGLDHITAVSAGKGHDLAVKSDGTVWTWGFNIAGEMGKPVRQPGPEAGATGENANPFARLAARAKANSVTTPEQIKGLTGVIAAAAGDSLSVVLKSDGTVWTCGVNAQGQLGNGAIDEKATYHDAPAHHEPSQVKGLANIIGIAVGDDRGGSGLVHVLALDSGGNVWSWGMGVLGATEKSEPSCDWLGRDNAGKVMVRTDKKARTSPARVWGLPKIKAIAASYDNNLALSEDGNVYAWGGGELCPRIEDTLELAMRQPTSPDGTPPKLLTEADSKVDLRRSCVPIRIVGLDRVAAVAVNRDCGYAMKSDGTVLAWGVNDFCTLGSGKDRKAQPKAVEPVRVANLIDAGGIAAGGTYALAIRGVARETFLKWYLEFSKLIRSRMDVINRVRAEAGVIAIPLMELRSANLALFKTLEGARKSKAIKEEYISDLEARLSRQSGEVHAYLGRMDTIAAEGDKAAKDILDHLNKGFDKYGTPYLQEFLRWKKKYEEIANRLPFDLALASGDDEKFLELVDKAQFKALSPDLRVLLGKRLIACGDLPRAIEQLRTATRVDPGSRSARDAMTEAQIIVIRCALEKSQDAIGQARAAFETYLTATGYPPRDYSKTRPLLARMLMGPLDETNRDEAWALVVHGVVNVCDRVAGRLGGEELKLDQTTGQMTRNFLALHVIMRLLARGHTLEEIQAMIKTGDGVPKAIPLKQPDGTPYTQAQINDLRMSMKAAMELPELQALVDPTVDLRRAMARPYFDKRTVADTAIDTFGAALISNAIILALPMAEAYSMGGRMVTVTEMAAQAVRWDKAMAWVGTTRAGELMLKALAREKQFADLLLEKDLLLSFASLKGGQLLGIFLLQQAAVEQAAKYGGPKAAAITQAAVILVGDPTLLARWLRAGRIPKTQVVKIIDKYLAEGEELAKRIEAAHADRVKLRKILEKKGAGATLLPEESEFLSQRAQTVAAGHIPNGSPGHDGAFAEKLAAEKAMQGVESDGKKVVEEFDQLAEAEAADLQAGIGRAKKARDQIKDAPDPPPPPAGTICYNPAKKAPADWGPYEIPPCPIKGKNWSAAEEAMARGDYDEAKRLYDKAVKNNEMPDDLLDLCQRRTDEAAIAKRLVPGANADKAARALTAEIPPADADALLLSRWGERVELSSSGSMSKIYEIPGRPEYIIKEIVPNPAVNLNRDMLAHMAESEVAACALARELGISYPGVSVRLIRDAKGEVEAARLLIRRINGENLDNLTSGELFLYRQELAESRAFAHLISDYDRKLDNYFRSSENGLIYYLDAGMADIRGAARGSPGINFTNRGIVGIDHWYARSYKYEPCKNGIKLNAPGTRAYEFAGRLHLVERSMTYNDARPAVDRILELVKPANETRLRDVLTRAYKDIYGADSPKVGEYVNQAIETLRLRASKLEEVMKSLNDRNGRALPGATSGCLPCDKALPCSLAAKRMLATATDWRLAA